MPQLGLLAARVVGDARDPAGDGGKPAGFVERVGDDLAIGKRPHHHLAERVVAQEHRVGRRVQPTVELDHAPQGVVAERRQCARVGNLGDAACAIGDGRIVVRPLDLRQTRTSPGQAAAKEIVGERQGLVPGVGLTDEIAPEIVAVRRGPHVGVGRGDPAPDEIVRQVRDVTERVRHAHEGAGAVVGVGRRVGLETVHFLDACEAPVDVEEPPLDVAALIRQHDEPGRIGRSHAGPVGGQRLRLPTARVVGEPGHRRGVRREVRGRLRGDQPARVVGRLALDDLGSGARRLDEIRASETVKVAVAPDGVGRAVDRRPVRADALGRRVAEVEVDAPLGAEERATIQRADDLGQATERVVYVGRRSIVRIRLADALAPTRIVGERGRVPEARGHPGRVDLAGALVGDGRRAAAGIGDRDAVAVAVVGRRDGGVARASLAAGESALVARQQAARAEQAPAEPVVGKPALA